MQSTQSPFKFLDAYTQNDFDIFFGREKETEDLYNALSGVKHLLVYGPSGAGKTSLIECGLRNQFSEAAWFALSIRKGENINASVFARINEALEEKMALHPQTQYPKDESYEFGEAIERLFDEKFQPIYLLFDQFEELLILGEREEQEEFFTRLDRLIRYKVPCRILLIMREEFIGHLSEFETLCPSIFEYRFRLEKMSGKNVSTVIQQTLEAKTLTPYFTAANSEQLAQSILHKLPDKRKEIELTYVQVFLDELWQKAKQQAKGQKPVINSALIEAQENLENILDSFLKKQLKALKANFPEEMPIEVLVAMLSKQNTKLQLNLAHIAQSLESNQLPTKDLPQLMQALEERRIIRATKVGEQSQYEVSHDTLALVIGQNRTEEMQRREKANEIYTTYRDREGFFSQEDLDYFRTYANYWKQKPAFAQRIRESEQHIKAQRNKKLRNAWLVAGFSLLISIIAIIFYVQAEEARAAQKEQAQIAQEERDKAKKEERKAKQAKKEALAQKDTAQKALAALERQIDSTLAEQKRREIADTKRKKAERTKKVQEEYNKIQERLYIIDRIPKNEKQDKIEELKKLLKEIAYPENKKIIQRKLQQIPNG